MESPSSKSALKFPRSHSAPPSPAARGGLRYSPPRQAIKSNSLSRDEVKDRQGDKSKVITQKPPAKEYPKKPQDFKLHTQERAAKRAWFNYMVATKLYLEEQEKKQIERVQKLIEEEEVRMLRKEMIPRAQLMPFFDRPFFPQRSSRPLTVPREPSFMAAKCSRSILQLSTTAF
ncbi:hypothetical protein NMG60_11007618 [Bertholletia excelsa]